MKSFSIRQKLLLITMASSAAALVLMTAALLTYTYFSVRQQMRNDLSTLAQVIGDQSTATLTYNDKVTARENLASLTLKKQGIIAAALYTPDNLFVSYSAAGNEHFKLPSKPGPDGWQFTDDHLSGFQHIFLSGEDIGAIYICSDLKALHWTLWRNALTLLLFVTGSLLLAWLLASRLQQIISRPISHLAQTAEIVSQEKNYSIRAQKESEDELGRLIEGFNSMLEEIQRRDNALMLAKDELEDRVEKRTQDLQQQFRRITLLNQITYAVAKRQDFESIIQVVLQQLEENLPVDYSSTYRFNATTNVFEVIRRGPKSHSIAAQLEIPSLLPLEHTIFLPCLKGETVFVPDVSKIDQVMPQKMARAGFNSIIAMPLIVEDKVMGVLVLQRRPKNAFSEAEREFLRGLSAHIALAIQQVQLYQNLQQSYEELRKTQQAVMRQERLKALGQMASGIAHDINNALSPIVGYSDLLVRTEPLLSEKAKRHLGYIKASGEDITHIVAGLREFYRVRDDNEALLPLNINQLAEQVIGMTAPRWSDMPQSRGVVIEMKRDFTPQPPEFAGIESEIREAVINLVINATDALAGGGTITIRTRSMNGLGDNSPCVAIEVIDTGVGMDEQTRKRCLEPFYSTKGQRGTGLGLSRVYGIVERHEGTIEIDSQPGKGTTMRLLFPAKKNQKPVIATPESEVPGPFRILCIDDESSVRELLKEMLGHDGHSVEVADGGTSGLEYFRTARRTDTPFDVVITDLGMPHMDGREVAANLKKESPDLPVIMLTGWGVFMNSQSSNDIDDILSKPPKLTEIRAALRRVLNNAR